MAPGPIDDPSPSTPTSAPTTTTPLPKGMVLGPDGKPCRSCTSSSAFKAWTSLASSKTKPTTSSSSSSTTTTAAAAAAVAAAASSTAEQEEIPQFTDCPPDVTLLGRSTWTLLHSITATYPVSPSPAHQRSALSFVSALGTLYPCWHCAGDFREWMARDGNAPRVSSREEFGRWMCEAHNAVNVKLGKGVFDCGRWEERWGTGWRDGRCD